MQQNVLAALLWTATGLCCAAADQSTCFQPHQVTHGIGDDFNPLNAIILLTI